MNLPDHADMQAEIERRQAVAKTASGAITELMRQFGIEDFNVAQSPFGQYVTVDINSDEAIELTDRIHEALSN